MFQGNLCSTANGKTKSFPWAFAWLMFSGMKNVFSDTEKTFLFCLFFHKFRERNPRNYYNLNMNFVVRESVLHKSIRGTFCTAPTCHLSLGAVNMFFTRCQVKLKLSSFIPNRTGFFCPFQHHEYSSSKTFTFSHRLHKSRKSRERQIDNADEWVSAERLMR